jgi:DNA topoisomerase-1
MDALATTEIAMPDPAIEAAEGAGLLYASDTEPGIRRQRRGKGFRYADAKGRPIRDKAVLQRIHELVIPPAWEDVWICESKRGHIQATGRDARGRKQYIYHPKWREARDLAKYEHTLAFAAKLPAIRARVEKDMRRRGVPREKVLAAIVHLLDTTLIRIGNKDYAEQNDSFGLTTLKDRHAVIDGADLRFAFKGKSGRQWRLRLRDRRIARIVKDCQDIPGQHLFQYFDAAGERRPVTSSDVNAYLREIAGGDVTAKDFRTWSGTVLAAVTLCALEPFTSATGANRNVRKAVTEVAACLGNTVAVCRKCYIHPEILESYLGGGLAQEMAKRLPRTRIGGRHLSPEERAVLAILRHRLKHAA